MKIQATTHSGKPFMVAVTLTGRKDWEAVTRDTDRIHLVEVQLADGELLWVSPTDCRTDRGDQVEVWPWPTTKSARTPA